MSTTRHLVNRRRRLAALRPVPAPPAGRGRPVRRPRAGRRPTRRAAAPLVLAALTVLLAAFAVLAHVRGEDRRSGADRHNTALADTARTSEVKGAVEDAVQRIFSYDHTDPGRGDAAARSVLTGAAVDQYRALIGPVRQQGPGQRLVLSTTVTDSGVERVDGDRARVLVFADQSSTRTGRSGGTTVAAAMFAVDAVQRDGAWRISSIDTFHRAADPRADQK
ncbi:hypothetical protein [Streptomyces sp. cg36]|uniref:hypothetical protein n=1 Tax=Streptomyces sp. cg36 TaxID=3238798 RepID=UPI0034E1C58E